MTTLVQDADKHSQPAQTGGQHDEGHSEARRRRAAALKRIAGLWADRKDIPADGLEYQREMRAEWR
ncbi:hypothetical protein ACFOLJ_12730 [Rugamonas sp. CCM 8940]|uniref:hypothetical protein n=1 Tax=Rugamonas sp. CCM 8940 TaxID=2765359 RepID=UPI0018F66961|nr:hypothetical protein [Rugamonas sp. CCM 8940]MBJ7313372.1 hypothetical protein [Rugamonas sp. CCM 8940]